MRGIKIVEVADLKLARSTVESYNEENVRNAKLSKGISRAIQYQVEKEAQPFIGNDLLEELVNSQTPTWVDYLTLIFAFISLIVAIASILIQKGVI